MRARVNRLVRRPGILQEPHKTRIVHRLDRRHTPPVGLTNLMYCVSSEHLVDRIRASGMLEGILEPRRLDFGKRSVLPLTRWCRDD